jgi:hypothetical protein
MSSRGARLAIPPNFPFPTLPLACTPPARVATGKVVFALHHSGRRRLGGRIRSPNESPPTNSTRANTKAHLQSLFPPFPRQRGASRACGMPSTNAPRDEGVSAVPGEGWLLTGSRGTKG